MTKPMTSALRIPTKFRLQALAKAQSTVFRTPYNPQNLRTADKYLTKKLKGPLVTTYYPPVRPVNFKQLNQIFVQTAKAEGVSGRDLEYWKLPDLREEKRLDRIAHNRKRGKGPPKKGEGRRTYIKYYKAVQLLFRTIQASLPRPPRSKSKLDTFLKLTCQLIEGFQKAKPFYFLKI
ncbi:hypothetical protein O181_051040 [Austropuccinia psidii MF-1]|uniref:Small ribosomal subunit protein mS33 n=1 Tax=Austropuccinia psidii MF-1 TaxID=1389203 RepID=A0A9Q3E286_9BASI|nr:hypothetical protein [Austropuccinia psidii MF-1]